MGENNNSTENEEIEYIIKERLDQIYKRIIKKGKIKKAKKEEEKNEEDIENILTKIGLFEKYCEYEETKAAYLNLILLEYYKEGFKDAYKLIKLK